MRISDENPECDIEAEGSFGCRSTDSAELVRLCSSSMFIFSTENLEDAMIVGIEEVDLERNISFRHMVSDRSLSDGAGAGRGGGN